MNKMFIFMHYAINIVTTNWFQYAAMERFKSLGMFIDPKT